MIVRIIDLIFLFIIGVRFPRGKPIADITRKRYSEAFVKKYEGLKSAILNCGNAI